MIIKLMLVLFVDS